MSTKKIQLKRPIVENPDLQAFIDALIHNNGIDSGQHHTNDKRPTVQELIDAEVPNAENII